MALVQPEGNGCAAPQGDRHAAPQEEQRFKDVCPTAPVNCLWGNVVVKDNSI